MTIADTSTGAAQATAPRAVSLTNLTVERRRDPLGIDAARPRFGWQLVGDGPGARQAACQIQVIDTSQPGAGWSAPVWDSNRLEGPASTYVAYAGPSLESRRRYAWRVRAWDGDGAETQWSTPGEFEMGLLSPTDWSASWIALTRSDLVSEPEEVRADRPAPLLRRTFRLTARPAQARLYITALGIYDAFLNGERVGAEWLAPGWTDYNTRVEYQTYDVTNLLREGVPMGRIRLVGNVMIDSLMMTKPRSPNASNNSL